MRPTGAGGSLGGSHYQFVKPGHRTVPVQKHSKEIVGAYLKQLDS